jgi:hypothetical protein
VMIKIKKAYLNISVQLNGDRRFIIYKLTFVGPGSVAGTISHGMDSPGIEKLWGRNFSQWPIPAMGSIPHPV